MPEPDKTRIQAFEDSAAFWHWLEQHHASEPELWLKIYKKGSGQKSINWEEAVVEALCWGWIDGVKKSFDDEAYLQRFTPRQKSSNWSKRNREHVERLMAEGRMQEVGMVHVRAAQADGRWEAAYAPPSEMTVPEDFLAALEERPQAKAFFETLNRQNQYAIAYRLQTAKKPETRQKRFEQFLAMLEKGEKLY
ncbi:MAG: YdeI/OmpD-associated family protein [Anaerolineaceae bacterium]|nr:YdeI/OmpD-associated family protein [Anaerolineaceae bacterium]MCB9099123.1 YdeI/OmpD-associated family protein [Anaerolineales bacterium]